LQVRAAEEIIQPTVLAAGYKGAVFVAKLIEAGIGLRRIVSYSQVGDQSDSFARLTALGQRHGIPVEDNRRPVVDDDRLVFLVGWQYLLGRGREHCVVFHDSLLPDYRGFSPTVTALLSGADSIGVSALLPDEGIDSGPICGRRKIHAPPGVTLQTVFDLQAAAMADLAVEILGHAAAGTLAGTVQEAAAATYSIWRDGYDFFIDWRLSAADVLCRVRALGFPYDGAKGVLNDQVVTIQQAALGPDLSFAIRDPGKLWQVAEQRALVVCGEGTLWIEMASDEGGRPFRFTNLRSRFLTADNAWITPFLRR
jgi:methionyl-tRNA formyltransferase